MKVRYDEGLASHIALESCAYHREVLGEGLTEARVGQPLSREMMNIPGCRRFCTSGRPHGGARYASALTPGAAEDLGMHVSSPRGSREISPLACSAVTLTGPHREGEEPKPMMNEREKSDPCIVAGKPANNVEGKTAEWVEPRRGTEGNMGKLHMRRTQSRESVTEIWSCTRAGAMRVTSSSTRGRSPVCESCSLGSVRGVPSDGHSYRDAPIVTNSKISLILRKKNDRNSQ